MRLQTWRVSPKKLLKCSVAATMILSSLSMAQANGAEAPSPKPAEHSNVANSGQKVETLRSEDGKKLTAKWDETSDKVELYVDGEYKNTVKMSELKAQYRQEVEQNDQLVLESRCGHILNGVAIANGLLWTAAGTMVPAGPAALVPGAAGVVTSGIIGVAGAMCKD